MIWVGLDALVVGVVGAVGVELGGLWGFLGSFVFCGVGII